MKAISMRMFFVLAAGLLTVPNLATAQPGTDEVAKLRAEMETMRRDYERRMADLEVRLKQIEQPPAAVKETARRGDQLFAQDTESRDRALALDDSDDPARVRLEKVLEDFVDFSGYFRAGYGRTDQDTPQSGFGAPGAPAKYRLGNEGENYGEIALGKNWYVPGTFALAPDKRPEAGGPIARFQTRIAFYNPYVRQNSAAGTDVTLPEAWASIGNLSAAQPDLKLWAGSRLYRRHDIHVNDFYFLNMSGAGGGVEDIATPFGKVAFAWIGVGAQSGLYTDIPQPDPENEAGFNKGNFDLRLYDVALPLGRGEFAFVFANADAGRDVDGNELDSTQGTAFSFIHTAEGFGDAGSVNKLSLQAGTGPALTFTSGFETRALEQGSFIRVDDEEAWRFRVTEHLVAQVSDAWAVGPVLVYQKTDFADDAGNQEWFSAGVRPVWTLSRNVSVAFEGGADWVREEAAGTSDALYKITLAPQVALSGGFFERPVLRLYATYATWGDDFVGRVGGADYADRDHGLSFGTQMETWW